MINDKRIEALNEEISTLKRLNERHVNTINKKDKEIRQLLADKGILERMLDISRRDLANERAKNLSK